MISKIGECAIWALFIIGFGSIVYKVNFILGIIYTIIMGTLWILLIFSKEDDESIEKTHRR